MQKKISTTFWFTVAIAIVALLACTEVVYTEVGAGDAPVGFFPLKLGDGETIEVVFNKDRTIDKVRDPKTGREYTSVELFICEGEKGAIDPKRCYKAEFGTSDGCLIDGNPRYYGYGGDGYKRE